MTAGQERARAYRVVADLCRRQAMCVASSGWSWFSRRCAIINLRDIADLCDEWEIEAEKERASVG